ncbi:hypothetical protein [Actinophytocola sp. NPDC049390]|uniref:hypothetical protein n=1 Tax=Actinophytocola sp. NPDC049390 TaxID=3363894 RepID=UPI0037BC5778
MSRPSIDIVVPEELATLLVADGHAQPATGRRSGAWEVIASFATGGATTVSLLQIPQTVAYFADKCRTLAVRKRENSSAPYYMEAKGPYGQLRIPITPDTSTAQIERLLRRTIFNKDLAE